MYTPSHFRMEDRAAISALIRENPLGTLVTLTDGKLCANHVPFLLRQTGDRWVLAAHVARANPVWRETDLSVDALVVFTGPDAYVSPSWYESKREHGRVVPTWNYIAAHLSGPVRVIENEAWLHALVSELTDTHEAPMPAPWKVADAPSEYVAGQLKAIVGIEIEVTGIEAKWKASQNRPANDARGVAEGLRESSKTRMAEVVDGLATP